jgi:serine/threonine protein kinase
MLRGVPYGHEVDWWALGVTMFKMLTGRVPFPEPDTRLRVEKIVHHEVEYPRRVSEVAKTILRKVSVINSMIEVVKYYRVGLLQAILLPGHVFF